VGESTAHFQTHTWECIIKCEQHNTAVRTGLHCPAPCCLAAIKLLQATFIHCPLSSQAATASQSDVADEEQETLDAATILNSCEVEVPAFLQNQNATQFTLQNADEVAELVAAAPGPLGQPLAAEDWYDAVIHGYLASAWKDHAQQMVQDLRSVVTVRFNLPLHT
jgi:hypothetical protein